MFLFFIHSGEEVILELAGNDPNIRSAIKIIKAAKRIVKGYVAEYQIWLIEIISINRTI